MAVKVCPPSRERYKDVFATYTVFASLGSAVMPPKYQPRCHNRFSFASRRQLAPASSERYIPPALASTTAYTRLGSATDTSMPMRPNPSLGRPCVSCFQVLPPSVDLYSPLPGPFDGG